MRHIRNTSRNTYLGLLLVCSAALTACGKPEATAPATAASTTAPAPTSAATPTPAALPTPTPAPTATAAATTTAAEPQAENAVGKSVFGKTCAMCHAAGVAGAPKPGDKADWGPRIAQGNDVLYKHALEGFNGAKGAMPARGGSPALKDDEVKAAVDFMVAQSR